MMRPVADIASGTSKSYYISPLSSRRSSSVALPRLSATRSTPSLTPTRSILKYVLLGDSGTGKSSLLIRLTDDRFVQSGQEPTLGVEFGSRILEVNNGKRVKVQCESSLSHLAFLRIDISRE